MPKYDYKCENCETIVEIQRSITDSSPQLCDICNEEMSKVYSPVGVTFKGSGFYKTDSRGK